MEMGHIINTIKCCSETLVVTVQSYLYDGYPYTDKDNIYNPMGSRFVPSSPIHVTLLRHISPVKITMNSASEWRPCIYWQSAFNGVDAILLIEKISLYHYDTMIS